MKHNTYLTTVSVVFTIVASGHLLRVIFDWSARIGTWDVPMWMSWPAIIVAGILAYHGFRLNKK
ncbi:hypothetical protein A3A20_02025 [Candidatus Wolfebacteria bacterium RIFCSPLOWO2_01_FULL_45_19]|uniref:DUF5668 domain-containing protein n=1 Tax=Candidatus Wolfebacteria bacterium RIFCSPLOWO2_01_FULL_45_19 TaxID=1802557 RepID=A0A1F8DSU4_9BACT|nr:MAG: hypothetical protein UX23_C0001G0043 [Parcubacteria group bacterium GW2011_GWB1_45_9]OGM91691.1 MAG: hypothetical protein A3A20_02025 [Candidatus Wolfebacteria bacterium RIFCSPLOWO2_01_FULL_45_19]